ncbi:MAG: ABC transporter permease [Flavobacteriales bacterium]|nr:ABC transporter permease [Flavobacteriales bacterium]
MHKRSQFIAPLITFIVITFVWWASVVIFDIPKYVLPSPNDILVAIIDNSKNVLKNLLVTSLESILGLILGSLFAIIVGVLMAQSRLFSNISLPYLIASNAIPVIAIAPILIIWFGNGIASKVVVAAFLCFFPLCMNTYKGLNDYSKSYQDLFKIYGASKWDFLWRYKIFNARVYIVTGFKLNASFCVIGAIVAEIISSNKGLGFGILQATYTLNVPLLWGYILIACLLGLLFYTIVLFIEKLILKN